jgi:TolA-binding protein
MAENPVVLGNIDNASHRSEDIASANQDVSLAREPEKQRLEKLSQEILELKQTSLANVNNHSREIQKLRRHLRWLTGLSLVAILGLGGTLAGVTYSLRNEQISLRNEQNKIAQQVESIDADRVSTQQLDQLRNQINSLNQQAKELSKRAVELSQQVPQVSLNQLEAIRDQLQELETSIRENFSNAVISGQLKQLNEILSRSLQAPNKQTSVPPSSNPPQSDAPMQSSTSSESVGGSTNTLSPSQ